MKKPETIAIYSGVSLSTTFIERLVKGLATAGTTIYIFGSNSGKPNRQKNVKYVTYGRKWHKLFVLFKYTLILSFFKPKEKKRIYVIIRASRKSRHLLQLKYYPVLYHKPDIFHIQWAKSIVDWVWVKNFGMRLVLSLRGAHINYSPIVDEQLGNTYKKLFSEVSGFHAVSIAIAEEVTKYNADFNRIKIIKSGLKLDDFSFELKAYNIESPLNIISVGRDHWKKNYKMALNVMFALKQYGVKFQYTIVGVYNNEALVYQRSQLGLEDEVRFIDTLPFKNVQAAIQLADVMLLPSVEEGIANVVLEAMALGTLVVSTNCGGMAEVVLHNETGFLVLNRDVQSMSKALIEISKLTKANYQKITRQARVFVEQHHNEDKMVVEMQSLYENLIPQKS